MGHALIVLSLLSAALPGVVTTAGKEADPFAGEAAARVLIFVRSDCPITNRYAPEMQRLSAEFSGRAVHFWLVYSDRAETAQTIGRHVAEYHLPGTPILDLRHELARRAQATVSPEAAVFDRQGKLLYLGRIDDRYIQIGKSRPSPTTHDLESAISAVLSGRAPEPARTRAVGCFLADLN